MKWVKDHGTIFALAIAIIGATMLCILASGDSQPVLSITDGVITVCRGNVKIGALSLISIALIAGGTVGAARNEARAYYNRKTFFDGLRINGKRK